MGILSGGGGGGIGGAIGSAISSAGGGSGGSGLIGSALGIGASFGAQALAESAAINTARQVRRFSRDIFSKRYQLTMADMAAAGLNPILAASGGFQVGGQPSGVPAQIPMAQIPGAISAGAALSQARTAAQVGRETVKEKKENVARLIEEQGMLKGQASAARELALLHKVRAKLEAAGIPMAEERFAMDNSADGRRMIRRARGAMLNATIPTQAKELFNPFNRSGPRLRFADERGAGQ